MADPARAEQPVHAAGETSAVSLQWAAESLQKRLHILRRARIGMAQRAAELADAVSGLPRSRADTLAAEVLPLLAAMRFLERQAPRILATRKLGRRGLPFWLSGVRSLVERVPYGTVLVIGPSNYPLLIPGVQTLQALAAGNAVVWKPGVGGQAIALVVAEELRNAGLPDGLLRVTGESIEESMQELALHPDKVVFTGSAQAGRAVLHAAAEKTIPVIAELSGSDAVVVLGSADQRLVVDALVFGLRFNGSQTCMAPRRLMLVGTRYEALLNELKDRVRAVPGVMIREPQRSHLRALFDEAVQMGATVAGDVRAPLLKPILILNGKPEMRVAKADLFAPVLTVLAFATVEEMLAADALCPFGLTAAVFGDEKEALAVGRHLKVGTVLVNDLIVPTADPRVPFGGRRGSGFGVTRGVEGLLAMTTPRTVLVRRRNDRRHYEAASTGHEELFHGVIASSHGPTLRARVSGLRRVVEAAKQLKREKS